MSNTSEPLGTVGNYRLLRRIAQGGMAELFLAQVKGPGGFEKRCALKRVLPEFARDREFVRMFLNEARVAALLDHPNIVHIFDLQQDEATGQFYIAMELVDGINLAVLVEQATSRGVRIPSELSSYMMAEVLDGLAYAHALKDPEGRPLDLVHRDISPHNILLSRDGAVKVVDFGIAKAATNEGKTQLGVLKGKLAYMSPEQLQEEPLDGRSDVFGVGVCLYELIAGRRPFVERNQVMLIKAVLECNPADLSSLAPDCPPAIRNAVHRAMAKDPADRFKDARAFQEALSAALRQTPEEITRHVAARFLRSLEEPGATFDAQKVRIPWDTGPVALPVAAKAMAPVVDPTHDPLLDRTEPNANRHALLSEPPLVGGSAPRAAALVEPIVSLEISSEETSSSKPWAMIAGMSALLVAGTIVAGTALFHSAPGTSDRSLVQEPLPTGEAELEETDESDPALPSARGTSQRRSKRARPAVRPASKDRSSTALGAQPSAAAGAQSASTRVSSPPPSIPSTPTSPTSPSLQKSPASTVVVEIAPPPRAPDQPSPPSTSPAESERPAASGAEGRLTLTSDPPGLRVQFGLKLLGETPLKERALPAGPQVLTLRHPIFGIAQTLVVQVPEGRTLEQHLTVPKARLEINSSPSGATVLIDGVRVGTTPLSREVYEGKHSMRLRVDSDGRQMTREITLRGGQTERIDHVFEAAP